MPNRLVLLMVSGKDLYEAIYVLPTTDIGRCGDGRSFPPFGSLFFRARMNISPFFFSRSISFVIKQQPRARLRKDIPMIMSKEKETERE